MDREILNAVIQKATIHIMEGFLTVSIAVKHPRGGQGFGQYVLALPKDAKHYKMESVAGHFIYRCMEIADVTEWDKMIGRNIRVDMEHSKIHGIGHIIKEDWFYPEKDFDSLNKK